MKKILFLLPSLLIIGCSTLKYKSGYSVSEVPDYNQRISFLCDSLKLQKPTNDSWNQLFTVGDSSINYARYIWYDVEGGYIKMTVYDTDTTDTVILSIERK